MKKVINKNLIAAIAIISAVCIAANMFKVSATMSLLLKDLNINSTQAGWLVTTVNIIGIVLALPAGGITAKIGSKKIGVMAMVFAFLGSLLGYFSQSYGMLLFSRFIEGFGFAFIAIAVPSIITDWFDEHERGLPMAFWTCAMYIGLLCSLKLSNIITDESDITSWRNLWLTVTVLLAIMGTLFATFVPNKRHTAPTAEASKEISGKNPLFNKAAWCLAIVSITFNCGAVALNNFSTTYCQDALQVSLIQANNYTSFLGIGTIIGSVSVGVLLKYLHKYKLLLIIGMGLNLAMFTLIFSYSASWAAAYLFIMGIIHGLPAAVIYTLAPQTAYSPQTASVVMGILAMGQNLAGFSAVITGKMITIGYPAATLFIVALVGIGFAMSIVFAKFFARN